MNKKLMQLPAADRPREKAKRFGAAALSDTELLALLLHTGTRECDVLSLAGKILYPEKGVSGLSGLLNRSAEEYMEISGIGPAKALQLSAFGELMKRAAKEERGRSSASFRSPEDCAAYFMQDMRSLEQEELRAAYLDTRMRLISESLLTRGTVDLSVISVREILIDALKHRAVSMILLHNHPSGDPAPSSRDESVTEKVRDAGELIGIRLADHIIIGDNTYYSFKERGKL